MFSIYISIYIYIHTHTHRDLQPRDQGLNIFPLAWGCDQGIPAPWGHEGTCSAKAVKDRARLQWSSPSKKAVLAMVNQAALNTLHSQARAR